MNLIEVTDKSQWDRFVSGQPGAQFTQSWAWGEFRVSRGQEIKRFALEGEDGKWMAAALLIYVSKGWITGYWYAPRGPVIRHELRTEAADILRHFFEELQKTGVLGRALFVRAEPTIEQKQEASPLPEGFRVSHAYMPASTLVIDLTKDEEELLSRMHEKTRYNVRLAERKGVEVRVGDTEEDIDAFMRLNEETASRDRFISQPSSYIRATYEALHKAGMCDIRLAEKDDEVLAASMEMRYGDTVTYLYGASSNAKRNLMAPYALHWDAIRSAKAEDYRLYDFYGVNPEDKTSPYYKRSWEGTTRFKLGWGGYRIDYVGTWERSSYPLLYTLMRTFSK